MGATRGVGLGYLRIAGVFAGDGAGGLAFHPEAPPTDEEVARLVATIRTRIRRLLVRRGLDARAATALAMG